MRWVHAVLDVPAAGHDQAAVFWAAALGWPLGPTWPEHPELRSFEPPEGKPYVHLQALEAGPPAVHLDLEVDDEEAARDRAVALGAVAGPRRAGWQPMRSPGGLAFCLLPGISAAERPGPFRWGAATRTRLVQICIDSPAALHEAEVEFWRGFTAGRWRPGENPEFAGKLYPEPGGPIQLLLQRLGPDDEGTTVRAHLDLGSTDLGADASRLESLGATRLGPGRGWIALRDTAGLAFCVTENSPD